MRSINPEHEFDSVFERVSAISRFNLWGIGYFGQKFFYRMNGLIEIGDIYDKGRCGESFEKRVIKSPEDLDTTVPIIVTAVSKYEEIKKALIIKGMKENIDFFHGEFFSKMFMAYRENEIYLSRIDISVTKKCSLRCKNCNMFMPYYKSPQNRDIESVLDDLRLFFDKVKHLDMLDILGGEPCLHPQLPRLLETIKDRYGERIDRISIVSNGTVPFSEELIQVLSNPIFFVSISDYSESIGYQDKLKRQIELLDKAGIKYEIDSGKYWLDFGFPENPRKKESQDATIAHFHCCMPPFRGLDNGKLYRCHLELSAIEAGLFDKKNAFDYHLGDYVDLNNPVSALEFLEFDEGYSKEGYVSFCTVCNGCGRDNLGNEVPVAEQL